MVSRFGVVTAWEVLMNLHETSNAECTTQIDTIGWVVVMFVVAVATITGIALYVSL
jgi:hypothetical protein